jgi:hypothetical protein
VVQFGSHLQDNVFFQSRHRQYAFSIPKNIRRYFLYDRNLLGKLSQCASSWLTSFFRITLGKKLGISVIAMAIQTFGDYAKWHQHVHALVSDGLFTDTGYFYVMPKGDVRLLGELFRASDLKIRNFHGTELCRGVVSGRGNSESDQTGFPLYL